MKFVLLLFCLSASTLTSDLKSKHGRAIIITGDVDVETLESNIPFYKRLMEEENISFDVDDFINALKKNG